MRPRSRRQRGRLAGVDGLSHNRRAAASIPALGVAAAARLLLVAAVAGACGAAPGAVAAPEATAPAAAPDVAVPVVVELFTSQGCSSCPPADAALHDLAGDGVAGAEILPLAFHVDYWDRLGWRDPFSSPAWSQRQRRYAPSLATGRVYTPQAVVQGTSELNGSRRAALADHVARAAALPAPGTVAAAWTAVAGDDVLEVRAGLADGHEAPARLLVAITEDGLETYVPRGENARRTLAADHVVRRLDDLGTVAPGETVERQVPLDLPAGWRREALAAVVFLQEEGSLAILAAAGAAP